LYHFVFVTINLFSHLMVVVVEVVLHLTSLGVVEGVQVHL
jgi:hypothetical protein